MKLLLISLLTLISLNSYSADLPECKSRNGSTLDDSIESLQKVMKSNDNRPQVLVTGTIFQILPEDKKGLPHQKYTLKINGMIKLTIVSNLDFGRVPVKEGLKVTICGEFKKVGSGMVHWTHFDPHGGHPDGFTIVDGKLYGDQEVQ